MRHFIEDNGVRERWIFFYHIPSLVCDVPTTFTAVLKSQVPNDLKSKQKTWGRPPVKRWESGLFRLYIAPVSAYLRWYDTTYTEDKHERVNTQETKRLQFKMVDIQHSNYDKKITQGTANGGNNIVARILA